MSSHSSPFAARLGRLAAHAARPCEIAAGARSRRLVLFLLVWSGQRSECARAGARHRRSPGFSRRCPPRWQATPMGASGMEEPDEEALAERPRLEERPAPRGAAGARAGRTRARRQPPAMADLAIPTPISRPAAALSRHAPCALRETGTVRVLVTVGADGVPTDVSVESSSQSRDLDRAALDAVRKWRFRPAQRGGQAVAGSVVVPIEFRL
jgi:protein TonB